MISDDKRRRKNGILFVELTVQNVKHLILVTVVMKADLLEKNVLLHHIVEKEVMHYLTLKRN